MGPKGEEKIGLWQSVDLDESHRHHSHLGGIYPFDVFTVDDPEWRPVIERSLAHWIFRGSGLWSGWSMAWASTIHSHVGNAQAAEMCLEAFDEFFTNEGHGTLHDGHRSGFSLMGVGPVGGKEYIQGSVPSCGREEIMQMDGGMGATAAIQEMLLHTRRGVTHVFAGAPMRWKNTSFENMRTEGAFLVSASRVAGVTAKVAVKSLAGSVFRLANPWGGRALVERRGRNTHEVTGRVLRVRLAKGEAVTIRQPRG